MTGANTVLPHEALDALLAGGKATQLQFADHALACRKHP